MEVKEAFAKLRETEEKISAYQYALSVIYYDAATAAPSESYEYRGEVMGVFSGIIYELTACEETKNIVAFLLENKSQLTDEELREVTVFKRTNEFTSSIPKNEYVEYNTLLNEADNVWHKAKATNDYALFKPYLKKIIDFNRSFAQYYKPDKKPYDVLLDMYEKGLDTEKADKFFDTLKSRIVPLLKRVTAVKAADDSFLYKDYPAAKQAELSSWLMDVISLDKNHCAIGETEHPFTTQFSNKDVRITTHYYKNNLVSAMYSTVHEGGHALYEAGIDSKYDRTCLTSGVSMGIHESISRFFENIIGRSEAFVSLVYPKVRELFPEQLADVSEKDFLLAVNKAEPSLIRTEADELTYALHIMVRYELEKQLVAGELDVDNLPQAWNEKYKEYLGVTVPDDTHGVLQDSHWSGGAIGYFPSYALGSAYGAQIFAKMNGEFDVYKAVRENNIKQIAEWLRKNIFCYGQRYDPSELFEKCVGAPFDPTYFTDYLEKKYSAYIGDVTQNT